MHEIRDVFSFEISRPFSRDGFKTSPQLVLNANFPYENTKRNKIDLTCLDSLRLDMTFGIWLMSRQSRMGLARFVCTQIKPDEKTEVQPYFPFSIVNLSKEHVRKFSWTFSNPKIIISKYHRHPQLVKPQPPELRSSQLLQQGNSTSLKYL
jgi:hypothetical protein